jgi:prepilin-type N-terminal cleavage/methylation domain-containing protein
MWPSSLSDRWRWRTDPGFTLVELLIVFAIIGIVLSLVAPLTVDRIDRLRARSELAQLRRTAAELTLLAYARRAPIVVDANGAELRWSGASSGRLELRSSFFEETQHVVIGANGVATPAELRLIHRGAARRLGLNESLESRAPAAVRR